MVRSLLTHYGRQNSYVFVEKAIQESLKDGEIRVAIKYIGLSFTDFIIKRGLYQYQKDYYPLPFCQGFEFSGEIVETKDSDYKVGEQVCGLVRFGCFGDEVVVTRNNIFRVPALYTLREASTFPVNFFTAYHALHNIVKIEEDATVLIYSAAGGVGGMLVQLAKARGYKVIAIIGNTKKEEYVKSLGADYVFTEDILENLKKNDLFVDVVCDNSGVFPVYQFKGVLNFNAKIVVYSFNALVNKSILKMIREYFSVLTIKLFDLVYNNITVSGFNIVKLGESGEYAQKLKSELEMHMKEKKLIVPAIREYSFKDVELAVESFADRNNFGKVIMKV